MEEETKNKISEVRKSCNKLNKKGRSLFNDFEKKINSVADFCVEDFDEVQAYMLELLRSHPLAPIYFIKLEDLESLGTLPRFPNNKDITCELKTIDRNNSLLVFISHCWLRGDSSADGWDGTPHPDNAAGDKYKLCAEGLRRLKNTYAPRMKECFVWLDFGCLNQDVTDLSADLDEYDMVAKYCDCIFTPLISPPGMTQNFLEDFLSLVWNEDNWSYLNRAWCRVEMMYAANIPLLGNEGVDSTERHTMFEHGLARITQHKKRPHFAFPSDFQLDPIWPPLIMYPLQYIHIKTYHPAQGFLTYEADRPLIFKLYEELKPYIELVNQTVCYKGEYDDSGKRHGLGVQGYANGNYYKGEWVHDVACGAGVLYGMDGSEYIGDIRNGKKDGHGKFKEGNGATYEGEWKDDNRHGHGVQCYQTGCVEKGKIKNDVYDGMWENDKRHGKGTHQSAHGTYDGEWREDSMHGPGIYTTNCGDLFVGEWADDLRHGCFQCQFSDGSFFEGEYKFNKRQGFGMCVSGGEVYEGEWDNDKFHGRGSRTGNGIEYVGEWRCGFKHGHGKYRSATITYEGGWLNGCMHGLGTYQSDGRVYVGEWLDGVMHGQGTVSTSDYTYNGEWKGNLLDGSGTMTWANGNIYKGEWKDNKQNGWGTVNLASGEVYRGEWKNGKKHGKGIYIYPSGEVKEGEWEEGEWKCE